MMREDHHQLMNPKLWVAVAELIFIILIFFRLGGKV